MTSSPRLPDLIDLARLQRLLEGLAVVTGASLSLIEPDGTILASAGWQDICTGFHRVHQETLAACLDYDDTVMRSRVAEGTTASGTMRCPNGLCGFGLPLIVGGQHLATVFASQFFYEGEPVDRDAFRKRARDFGFDETAYLAAVDRVPTLSHERVKQAVDLLGGFVGLLADLGLTALERDAERDALLFSEDKFARAFHGSPDAVLITRADDGLIVEVNEGFTAISGYGRDEALGRTTVSLDLWADRQERDRVVADLQAGVAVREREIHARVQSGEVRDCLASFSFITVGGSPHILTVVRDVTEQRRTVAALRRSEALLRGILDNVQDAYVRADREGRVVMASPSAARLYGYASTDDMIGLPATALYADRGTRETVIDHVRQHGQVTDFLARGLREDGSTFWASLNAQVYRDAEGHVAGTEGFVRDVSGRMEAEAALRESEEKFKYLFEHSPIGLALTTPAGDLRVNRALAEMLGYTRDELERVRLLDVTHPDDLALTRLKLDSALGGTPVRFTKRFVRKDGATVWADVSILVRLDGDGRPLRYMTAILDITERRVAELEIRRLNDELEQRVRERTAELEAANRELESFAYAVSHDLRQPLRALDGFSQILLDDYAAVLDDEGRAHLERIRAADKRMGALIDALLELSRLTRGELARERLDLSDLARSVVTELAEDEPWRQVKVEIADCLVANADRRLVRALLVNLLGNAWKFTAKHDAARIEVGVRECDGERAFFVHDDGVGFDMAYSDKLFGAFQRLHSPGEFEGLGIGLATVQRIVHRHGGRVWAESGVDEGATFFFTLREPHAAS